MFYSWKSFGLLCSNWNEDQAVLACRSARRFIVKCLAVAIILMHNTCISFIRISTRTHSVQTLLPYSKLQTDVIKNILEVSRWLWHNYIKSSSFKIWINSRIKSVSVYLTLVKVVGGSCTQSTECREELTKYCSLKLAVKIFTDFETYNFHPVFSSPRPQWTNQISSRWRGLVELPNRTEMYLLSSPCLEVGLVCILWNTETEYKLISFQ